MYSGGYILQLGKALSVYLRAATDGVDMTETQIARRARFLAVKNATRMRRFRSIAVTDDVFVGAVMSLDLDYSWDATLFAAMCDAETLALRRMEVFQQDRADCEQVRDGERVTLPKTKADQQSEGICRLKRHWKGCEFAHDESLQFSKRSACHSDAQGRLDGRTRCQVCAKRYLFGLQGEAVAGEAMPSYMKLSKRARPSWEDPNRGTEDAATSNESDFVRGEAMRYQGFSEMFNQLLEPMNRLRRSRGERPIMARNWHWHGLRHGCAVNLHSMDPPMSEVQIAEWCRMSLWILQYYLKHNRTGADPTNRTDSLTGCNTLSLEMVAAWCARDNRAVQQVRMLNLLNSMELGTIDNFVEVPEDMLMAELEKFSRSLGERLVLRKAHRHFADLLRNGSPEQLQDAVEESALEGEVDRIYELSSMGRASAQVDREAALG